YLISSVRSSCLECRPRESNTVSSGDPGLPSLSWRLPAGSAASQRSTKALPLRSVSECLPAPGSSFRPLVKVPGRRCCFYSPLRGADLTSGVSLASRSPVRRCTNYDTSVAYVQYPKPSSHPDGG